MRNFSVFWVPVFVACVECIYVQQAAQIESEISKNAQNNNGANKTRCNTEACNKAAERIKMNMDRTADPCADFHKYACGKYKPGRFPIDTTYSQVGKHFEEYALNLIEKESIDSKRPIAKNISSLYKKCINNKKIDTVVIKSLSNAIESMGGWPGLTGNNETKNVSNNWLEQLALLRKNGFNHEIFTSCSLDMWGRDGITVGPPLLGSEETTTENYKAENERLLISAIDLLSPALSVDKETVRILLKSGLEFEEKLAFISHAHSSSPSYNLTKMQQFAPEIDWTDYLSKLLTPTYYTSRRLNLDKVLINFPDPDATKEIGKLISVTDPKVLTNYVMWRVVKEHIRNCTISPERKRLGCFQLVADNFKLPLLSLYMDSHLIEFKEFEALGNIIPIFTKEYLKLLEQSDSIAEHLKKQYLTRAQLLLTYKDDMLNETLIDEFYGRLIDEDFYKSLHNIRRFYTDNKYRRYAKNETEKTHWKGRTIEELTGVNTYDFIRTVLVTLSFFRDQEKPKYLYFGDSNYGSQLSEAIIRFLQDSIRPDSKKESSNSTLCKNSGVGFKPFDIGALEISYRAYNVWANSHSEEPPPADLELTPRQLLWMLSVSENCYLEWNLIVPNMKEFSAAFNCPVGAPMNPAQKCSFFPM